MKKIAFLLILFFARDTWALALRSVGSGNWSNPASWSPAQVPTTADNVTIFPGHVITVDVPTASAKSVDVQGGGTLKFSRAGTPALALAGGNLTVALNGTLDMGTEADPIVSATATLVLAKGSVNQFGLTLLQGSAFFARGRDKCPAVTAPAAGNPSDLQSQTTVALPASCAGTWSVGDVINIGASERLPSWTDQDERVTVTSITGTDPLTVAWSGALAKPHVIADTVRVADLTRNVVVRSSGTDVSAGGNASFFNSQIIDPAAFRAADTEFAFLGGNVTGLGLMAGTISSSTVRDAYDGVVFTGTPSAVPLVENSVLCGHIGSAMKLSGAVLQPLFRDDDVFSNAVGLSPGFQYPGARVEGSWLYGNATSAFVSAAGTYFLNDRIWANGAPVTVTNDGIIMRGNTVYNTGKTSGGIDDGVFIQGNEAVLEGNTLRDNGGNGVQITGSRAFLRGNTASGNAGEGFAVGGSSQIIAGNDVFGNGQNNTQANIFIFNNASPSGVFGDYLVGNSIHNGFGAGLSMAALPPAAAGTVIAENSVYSNAGGGLSMDSFPSGFLAGNRLGFDPSGASFPNNTFQMTFFFNTAAAYGVTALGNRIGAPAVDQLTNAIHAGTYYLAANENFSTGTVELHGDYALPAGSPLGLDLAGPTWRSFATTPVLMRGTGHAAAVTATDDATAVTQLVTLHYDGAQWLVEGSSTAFSPATHPGNGSTVSYGQFSLQFTAAPGALPEDRVCFVLFASSKDQGQPKRLLFNDTNAAVNGGKSRLTVAPSAALSLSGSSGTPAQMAKSGANAYTFLSQGALSLAQATVSNTDANGLQLSGAGAVQMSSVTFDNIGASGGAYLTLNSLASNATFYNMTFNDAPNRQPLNVSVQGSDSALRWYFATFGGPRSGDTKDGDPDQKVLWADAAGPDAPASFAAASGSNTGDVSLAWAAPWDRETDGSTSTLKGGAFLVFRSTDVSLRNAAAPSQAQILLSTTAVKGAVQNTVDGGLLLGSTYYYRLWAADEFGNASAGSDAQALPARVQPFAPPNFSAVATGNDIALTWLAPSNPPSAYRDVYLLQFSTVSAAGPWTAPVSIPASATSFPQPGLQAQTTYYYELFATDTGGGAGGTSSPAAAQAKTADIAPPAAVLSAGARSVGVPWTQALTISFSKAMDAASVLGAARLRRMKDNLGNAVAPGSQGVAVSISSNPAGTIFVLQPSAALSGNTLYELDVTTGAVDTFGKAMASSATLSFTTLMDHTVRNVAIESASGVSADIPANALPRDGYILGTPPPAAAAEATRKLATNGVTGLRAPLAGSLTDLKAYDGSDVLQAFSAPVMVSFPYADANDDGVVDGTNPPLKVKTLRVHWLDETTDTWQRLPSSSVDASAKVVSALTPHFTSFALIGAPDTDLTDAHAFPNPFLPGTGGPGVTFTGLGQVTTLRIYTAQGVLVQEWTVSDGLGKTVWDGRNRSGEAVASGLYIYKIKSGDNVVTGKLVVVR